MRFLKVLGWTVLGWIVVSVVIGFGFSLLLALAGESNPDVERVVGGLAGLAGIVIGLVAGMRKTAPRPDQR